MSGPLSSTCRRCYKRYAAKVWYTAVRPLTVLAMWTRMDEHPTVEPTTEAWPVCVECEWELRFGMGKME